MYKTYAEETCDFSMCSMVQLSNQHTIYSQPPLHPSFLTFYLSIRQLFHPTSISIQPSPVSGFPLIHPSICICIYSFIHLSIHLSIHAFAFLSISPSIHLAIHRPTKSSIHFAIHLSIYMPIHPLLCLSSQLSIHLFACPSIHSFYGGA